MGPSTITILLFSSLLCWSQGAPQFPQPRLYNYNSHLPQFGIFPLVQSLNNRAPGGIFYIPSLQSLLPHVERDNLFRGATESRVEFTNGQDEVEHRSPGYDGTSKYNTELDQETTFEAGRGKHVLLQFDNIDIEEGRQYEGCIYDWVEVRSNNTAITDKNGERYCGTSVPAEPILSKGNEMSVLFHSDRVNEGTGFSATLFEVSKVEEDSFVDNYQNWGPGFRISFDLLILREIQELQSIFAFLGRHFANVPQILLEGLKLRVTTSYPLTGKSSVKYETEVDLHRWMAIVIETKHKTDNTFDFVISVGGDEHTVEDVSAKAIEDVSAWDTHYALKPAAAVYKNLVIDPTTSRTDKPEDDGAPLPPNVDDGALLPPIVEDGLAVVPPSEDDDEPPEENIVEELLPPAVEENIVAVPGAPASIVAAPVAVAAPVVAAGAPVPVAERTLDKTLSNVGVPFIPFAGFRDWINAQNPVYTVAF